MSYSDQPERPVGVTIIAVLNIIGAIVAAGLALLIWGYLANSPAPTVDTSSSDTETALVTSIQRMVEEEQRNYLTLFACLTVPGAVLGLAIGIGLLQMRNWARVVALILYSLSAIGTLCSSLSRTQSVTSLIGLVLAAVFIFYLAQPRVSAAFRR